MKTVRQKAKDFIRGMEQNAKDNTWGHSAIYVVQDDTVHGSALLVYRVRGLLFGWKYWWTFRGKRITRKRAVEIMEAHW